VDGRRLATRNNKFKQFYENTSWCWVFLALASLVLPATRTVDTGPTHQALLDNGELGLTLAFDIEIVARLITYLPDWRDFFRLGSNWLDLILAIGSTIIQIPDIHKSSLYPWLTIFQLARFYRVILEVPRMRPLLVSHFRSVFLRFSYEYLLFISWPSSETCTAWLI
jgi:voltage-dependent calcium channel